MVYYALTNNHDNNFYTMLNSNFGQENEGYGNFHSLFQFDMTKLV